MSAEQDVVADVRHRTDMLLENYRTLLQCAEVSEGRAGLLQGDRDALDIVRVAEAIAEDCAQLQGVVDRLEHAAAALTPQRVLEAQTRLEAQGRRQTDAVQRTAARVAMDVDAALRALEAEYYAPVR